MPAHPVRRRPIAATMEDMRWIWRRSGRRSGVDLGTYVAPDPVEPAPVEQIVAEGALIGESVVRLALRNRVIVDALRDHRDLDTGALAAAAAREFERLADQEWESAERIRLRRSVRRSDPEALDDPDRERESERRERVHRAMSDAFAARAADQPAVAAVVEKSRAEAWSEVGAVLLDRAGDRALVLDRDPAYGAERADRIGALLALDLTRLAQERGVDL
jgi:hypothetical protein